MLLLHLNVFSCFLFKAAQFGKNVAVLDYVEPSPRGMKEEY